MPKILKATKVKEAEPEPVQKVVIEVKKVLEELENEMGAYTGSFVENDLKNGNEEVRAVYEKNDDG